VMLEFWMMVGVLLWAFWGAYGMTGRMVRPLTRTFVQSGFVRHNYRGQEIPVGMGVALWLGIFFTSLALLVLSEWMALPWRVVHDLIGTLAVGTGFLLIGLLDDAVGNRRTTGLCGHVKSLLRQGELTTGLLKALTGLGIGWFGAWLVGQDGWRLLLGALVIALTANSINLLDLRPGRACKGVLLFLALLAVCSLRATTSPAFHLLLGATLAYFPDDVKARTMMGDAGANLLGSLVGLLVVMTCTLTFALVWLGFLVVLHLYAERYSLSKAIEKNKVLRWLDVWGRSA
jgi:UDP-GlcNAc:undecaprenyl-phosphate GlcNAc-1-phosphate transferase